MATISFFNNNNNQKAQPAVYVDFDLNFARHPIKRDINVLTNEAAIVASVRNLVLTSKFETPFEPEFGSNVRKVLFENWSPALDALLAQLIAEVIQQYEPRVDLQQIDVTFDDDEAGYSIRIHFLIKAIPNRSFAGTFFLEKAR
jgi:phage baseplate assembly protein W